MNLVDKVKSVLGGENLERLADSVGISTDAARKAVDAAVPTVMAALGKLTATGDGANRLATAVDRVDPATLSGLGGKSLSEIGTGLLKSLGGDSLLSGLSNALSRFTGISGGSIGSVIGSVVSAVLGTLNRQKQEMGLDARGLTGLLEGQKANIAAAMPSGIGSTLANIPGVGDVTNWARGAADTAARHGRDAADATYRATRDTADATYRAGRDAADTGSSALKWLLPALGLLALAGLTYLLFFRDTGTPTAATTRPTERDVVADRGTQPTTRTTTFSDPAAAITTQTNNLVSGATETFSQIKDAASAEAALPKLKDLSADLDKLKTGVASLGADARSSMATALKSTADKITPLIDKAMQIPGVKEKIGPTVNEIRTKLTDVANPAATTITTQANNFVGNATEAFAQIKDAASAEAALPKLKELSTSLDALKTGASALGADARSSMAAALKTAADKLTPMFDRVLRIPGVKEKIGPTVDEIRKKLTELTTG
jgi:hypothetical protein